MTHEERDFLSYYGNFAGIIHSFRAEQILCNATLTIEYGKSLNHCSIFAASCSYFHKLFVKQSHGQKKNLSCQSRPRNITGRCRRTALIFIVRICCGNYIIRSWHNRGSHFFKSGLTQRFRMRASTRSAKLRKLCRTSQFADRNHRTTLR